MSEHKIEREAVIWAWRILHEGEPEPRDVELVITSVLSEMARPLCAMTSAEYARLVRVAIAYVEAAKNHIDTVLELETNLETVTAERDELRAAFSNSHLDKLKQENARLSAELKELRFRMEGLEK